MRFTAPVSSLVALSLSCLSSITHAHSHNMLKPEYCPDGPRAVILSPGVKGPHNKPCVESGIELIVKRGNTELKPGSVYIPGEVLSVTLPVSPGGQFLIEASGGATFPEGSEHTGCNGRRFANGMKDYVMPDLTMPADGVADVKIWAGFMQVRDAAFVTPTFHLKGPQPSEPVAPAKKSGPQLKEVGAPSKPSLKGSVPKSTTATSMSSNPKAATSKMAVPSSDTLVMPDLSAFSP